MSPQTKLILTFFDGKCFQEELLGLLPLERHTTGEIVFENISAFFQRQWSGYEACVPACDGCGSNSGRNSEWFGRTLVHRCPSDDILTLHCASDGVVRKTKRSATMDSVKAAIHFIPQAAVRNVLTCFCTMTSGGTTAFLCSQRGDHNFPPLEQRA